jgi:hypothetical protein
MGTQNFKEAAQSVLANCQCDSEDKVNVSRFYLKTLLDSLDAQNVRLLALMAHVCKELDPALMPDAKPVEVYQSAIFADLAFDLLQDRLLGYTEIRASLAP